MDEIAARAARNAAHRLAGELGARLPGDVEAAIRAREEAAAPDRYLDPISLASLLVSAAEFAWTVYHDRRSKSDEPPAPDVIERRVRVEIREHDGLTAPSERDRIIEVVVSELMRSTDP